MQRLQSFIYLIHSIIHWGPDCYDLLWCNVYFIPIFVRPPVHRLHSAEAVIYFFQIWNGMQHCIPKVWQVVLSNIPVQSSIVHSYVHGLLDCSCHIVALPAYDPEIFHGCCVASIPLVLKYRWWCFQMFFMPSSKCSRWLLYIIIFMVDPVTPEPVNHTALFVILSLSFGDTSRFFRGVPPLKFTCIPYIWQMFLKLSLMSWVYGTTKFHIFDNWELAVIIYNPKMVSIV